VFPRAHLTGSHNIHPIRYEPTRPFFPSPRPARMPHGKRFPRRPRTQTRAAARQTRQTRRRRHDGAHGSASAPAVPVPLVNVFACARGTRMHMDERDRWRERPDRPIGRSRDVTRHEMRSISFLSKRKKNTNEHEERRAMRPPHQPRRIWVNGRGSGRMTRVRCDEQVLGDPRAPPLPAYLNAPRPGLPRPCTAAKCVHPNGRSPPPPRPLLARSISSHHLDRLRRNPSPGVPLSSSSSG
jgi:hypothetical protein